MIAQKMFFVVAVTRCMFASVSIGAVEPKVFDNGEYTVINGNNLAQWFADRCLSNQSSEFGNIVVVEALENSEYGKQFSLAELKRARTRTCKTDCSQRCARLVNEKFIQYVQENNAIFCSDFMQQLNPDGELKNVSAIIMGLQAGSSCDRYKQWLENRLMK